MGRIKTKLVKRVTNDLISGYTEDFTADFEENKKIVDDKLDVQSKKLRNMIVGYVTRRMKKLAQAQ